ncbi:hypothetical protein JOM56_002329 [Amanita muscaria]
MRHPWFHTFATKRKVSPPDDSQQSFKRRKYSTLEHGFAHLTLTPDQDTDVPMDSSDMVAPEVSDHVVRPSSVEEPTDIKMRTSTWYEPEPDRIVVTELESSDDEQDPRQDEGQLYVSPALLNHIRSRTLDSSLDSSQNFSTIQSTSQALVLYRPLQLPGSAENSHEAPITPKDSIQSADIKEDDIMDVEL